MNAIALLLAVASPAPFGQTSVDAGPPPAERLEAEFRKVEPLSGRRVGRVEVLKEPEGGLLAAARDGEAIVSEAALASARTVAELDSVLAVAFAYQDPRRRTGGQVSSPARTVSSIVGAYVSDAVEERDRRDPYLRLPTTPPPMGDYPRRLARPDEPSPAVVAMSIASAAGVCESDFVSWLRRLAGTSGADVAAARVRQDARRVIKDLGMLAYSPNQTCTTVVRVSGAP